MSEALTQIMLNGEISILLFGVVAALGVATSFNPCMYAMIPLLAGFGEGQNNQSLRKKILIFILGFSLTLSLWGVAGSILIKHLSFLSHNWNLFLGSLFLLVAAYLTKIHLLAAALLKRIPIKMIFMYSKQKKAAKKTFPAIFILGATFGLLPAPCTTPIVISIIGYTAVFESTVLTMILLFIYAISHGLPLLIIGSGIDIVQKKLKISWLNGLTKKIIALIMLLLAGYYFFFAASIHLH
ncbi:MAG: cytochrome c biogenesis protein CcdA [Bacillota bacterium]|nr:cytochrome c biogenesis protein CcdA [Bacillota bacterium]